MNMNYLLSPRRLPYFNASLGAEITNFEGDMNVEFLKDVTLAVAQDAALGLHVVFPAA
jgi:hypothetical protein